MANVFNMGGGTDLVNATLKPGFPIIYSDGLGSHEETPTEEKTITVLGSSIVYAPYGLSGEVTPLDRSGFWFVTGDFTAQTSVPVASTTPSSGVTYDTGISDLDPSLISSIARAISNNSLITHETEVVYIDMANFHRKISVGDTLSIALDDATHEFRILGFNSNTLSDSAAYGSVTATGTAGMTFEMVTVYSTPYSYTSTASEDSSENFNPSRAVMYTSTLPALKEKFPFQWKSLMKSVKKNYVGNQFPNPISVELFFMRAYELNWTERLGQYIVTNNEQAPLYPYAYYKNATNDIRIKTTPQNVPALYYTDTQVRNTTAQEFNRYLPLKVDTDGDWAMSNPQNYQIYIAPLFCI